MLNHFITDHMFYDDFYGALNSISKDLSISRVVTNSSI